MKGLTIKWKMMLWYAALVSVLLGAALPYMYYTLSDSMRSDAKVLLRSEVSGAAESLEYENDAIKLDDDIDLVGLGIYITVYSNSNRSFSGKLPPGFDLQVQPKYGKIYDRVVNGQEWFVCDYKVAQGDKTLGWIRAVKSLEPINSTLKNLRSIILIIVPIFMIIALFGGLFIAKRALSPIIQITKTAKQIGQHDLTKRIRLDGPRDEVGMLAETFDEMLDRLEDSFSREKRFSSDVSHELRTPVAGIMLSAEEALQGNKTSAEYRETFQAILCESKKMSLMISQLLMMARSDEGKYMHEMEKIDISSLTGTIVEESQKGNDLTDTVISTDIEDGIIMIVEETLYMRLLLNLIDNAIKYSPPGGPIKVTLKNSGDFIRLSVEDSGIGISKENLPRIWDRFFKADPSRFDSSPGLGLPLVKWIAELHGGTVRVKSELGKGSLFEISFKADRQ